MCFFSGNKIASVLTNLICFLWRVDVEIKKSVLRKIFRKNNQSGFTLTEAMIGVCILSFVAGIFIVGYLQNRSTRNMHADARDLLSFVQQARFDAVRLNTCVGVALLPGALGDLSGVGLPNRGSYVLFQDDGSGVGTECDAICDNAACGGVGTEPILQTVGVSEGVAFTGTPAPATGNDPAFPGNPQPGLWSSVSFDSRSMVSTVPIPWNGARAIVFRNNPNPANATWWGRVIVSTSGRAEYQTVDNPANEALWSRQ